ncbi:MAG: hypothetical protein ACRBCS_03130 [Cellvibrionaceae bacterium]
MNMSEADKNENEFFRQKQKAELDDLRGLYEELRLRKANPYYADLGLKLIDAVKRKDVADGRRFANEMISIVGGL